MSTFNRVKAIVDGHEIEWELQDGTLWVHFAGSQYGVIQKLMALDGVRIEMMTTCTDGVDEEPRLEVILDDAILKMK